MAKNTHAQLLKQLRQQVTRLEQINDLPRQLADAHALIATLQQKVLDEEREHQYTKNALMSEREALEHVLQNQPEYSELSDKAKQVNATERTIAQTRKIKAIKLYRIRTKASLKESKDAIEQATGPIVFKFK